MRKHSFQADWRHVNWETGLGEQLKRINKEWKIKKHYYKRDDEFEYFN